MRGRFVDQGELFSYIAPEARVPANHPLRKIRELVRDVLGELSARMAPRRSGELPWRIMEYEIPKAPVGRGAARRPLF
jgi:hypothetical protein